jgi:hypothetical protein
MRTYGKIPSIPLLARGMLFLGFNGGVFVAALVSKV